MALAARVQERDFRVYCMLGDGELHEGQIWEAAMAASHFRLQGLVGIVDRNQLCIDGPTEEIMAVEPLEDRFTSFGWGVQRIDGHDFDAILDALDELQPAGDGPPQMIIADTVKGRGVQMMEVTSTGMSATWSGATTTTSWPSCSAAWHRPRRGIERWRPTILRPTPMRSARTRATCSGA